MATKESLDATRMTRTFYHNPAAMEPLFPPKRGPLKLSDRALEIVQQAGTLMGQLHPITQASLAKLLHNMNSYYSNLIEGHRTHPLDIEKALKKDFSGDSSQRALQLESAAHVEVEAEIDRRLAAEPELNVCSMDFLCWIHREFYTRMPPEFLTVKNPKGKDLQVIPGALRETEVEVGRHLPPAHKSLPEFLHRFSEAYEPARLSQHDRIIAAAAAHHRLAWIHPFLDGNGRVTRLFTHAYFHFTKVEGRGLWTITRGLARSRDEYMAALAFADQPRMGDLDGRGNLSEKALEQFCRYFLTTALDQVQFMSRLLEIEQLQANMQVFAVRERLRPEAAFLLGYLAYRGEIPRGEVVRFFDLKASQARVYLRELLDIGVVASETEKGPIRLAFPLRVVPYFFPKLFPAEVEFDIENAAAESRKARQAGQR